MKSKKVLVIVLAILAAAAAVFCAVRMWYNIFNKKANDKMTVIERKILCQRESEKNIAKSSN
ncbi:MAG: hypothetical protein IJB86_10035 [Clostridia bacterium]|nr:hypothetical protein [Clostridia bacterium]